MKILVLSDSHAALSFMRRCIDAVKPDTVIHLGDYYDDGTAMAEEYPHIKFYQVPGNCDAHRGYIPDPETRLETLGGARILMTHGHRHHVKQTLIRLMADARASRAAVVLFGHTHSAYCQMEEDGLWVLNPGSCGFYGGSAGLVEIRAGKLLQCRILREEDINVL
jgi:putative phosphoesterase